MAIGAHIGDAELTSGIILATKALQGYKIVTVALTAGERGNPPTMSVKDYRIQKVNEANKFVEELGFENEAIVFDVPDGELVDDESIKFKLAEIIRKYKPSMIFAHWKNSLHKDHKMAHKISIDAQFFAGIDMGDKVKGDRCWAPMYFAENWEDMQGFVPYNYFICSEEGYKLWERAIQNHWFVMNSSSFKYFDYYTHLAVVRGCLAKSKYAQCATLLEHQKFIRLDYE